MTTYLPHEYHNPCVAALASVSHVYGSAKGHLIGSFYYWFFIDGFSFLVSHLWFFNNGFPLLILINGFSFLVVH